MDQDQNQDQDQDIDPENSRMRKGRGPRKSEENNLSPNTLQPVRSKPYLLVHEGRIPTIALQGYEGHQLWDQISRHLKKDCREKRSSFLSLSLVH